MGTETKISLPNLPSVAEAYIENFAWPSHEAYVRAHEVMRASAQAILQSPEVQAWKRDAELGQCAMRFVDRAGDYCEEDSAERICDQFHAAMADIVDRHGAMRGMPSETYNINGELK